VLAEALLSFQVGWLIKVAATALAFGEALAFLAGIFNRAECYL
jgi:hypothetical protein